MKKIALLIYFLLNYFTIQSQNNQFDCGTVFTEQLYNYELINSLNNRNSQNSLVYDALTPYVFNLKFWQINASDGSNNINNFNFTVESEIMNQVKDLNNIFNQFNIFFKFSGFTILNNDYTNLMNYTSSINEFKSIPETQNTLNIVYANSVGAGGAFAHFNSHGIYIRMNMMISTLPNIQKYIIGHEMGHLLGLWHTDGSYAYSTPNQTCENVTRNLTDTYYNADIAGDFIIDTPAEPTNGINWSIETGNDCLFSNILNRVDCASPPILYTPFSAGNFMMSSGFISYSPQSCYTLNLTNEQGIKMRKTIINTPYQFYGNNPLSLAFTSVLSLFQPYKRIKIISQNINHQQIMVMELQKFVEVIMNNSNFKKDLITHSLKINRLI